MLITNTWLESLLHYSSSDKGGNHHWLLDSDSKMVTWCFTIHRGEHHSGVVVGDDICIAILWLVDFHVGVFPGKLLTRINGLLDRAELQKERRGERNTKRASWDYHWWGDRANWTRVCCQWSTVVYVMDHQALKRTYTNIMSLKKPQRSATGKCFYIVCEALCRLRQPLHKTPRCFLHCNCSQCTMRLIFSTALGILRLKQKYQKTKQNKSTPVILGQNHLILIMSKTNRKTEHWFDLGVTSHFWTVLLSFIILWSHVPDYLR